MAFGGAQEARQSAASRMVGFFTGPCLARFDGRHRAEGFRDHTGGVDDGGLGVELDEGVRLAVSVHGAEAVGLHDSGDEQTYKGSEREREREREREGEK